MRLMIHAEGEVQLGTLSAVVRRSNGSVFGLTAGHALEVFRAGDAVSFFPEGEKTRLGRCDPPVALGNGADLGRFEATPNLVMRTPLTFGRVPELLPHEDIGTLDGRELTFLGGQTGRSSAKLLHVGPSGTHPEVLFVRIEAPDIIPGDSGGPLYYDDGTTLFWVGTLVGGRKAEPGFSEARFLHPRAGLAQLQLSANG